MTSESSPADHASEGGASIRCRVYRCSRRADTYLFLRAEQDLAELPAGLLQVVGQLEAALDVALHPGRKLARADAATVMRALEEQGYYLQLPPPGHERG